LAFISIQAKAQYEDPVYDGYGGDCCSCVPTSSPTTGFPTAPPTEPVVVEKICITDGGYAKESSECVENFVYKAGSQSVKRSGCQSMVGKYKPYINLNDQPPLPSEGGDASLWCPIVAVYDPKKATKEKWGYCKCSEYGCLPDTIDALINQATSTYQKLTNIQQQKFKAVTKEYLPWYPLQPVDYSGANPPPCFTDGGKETNVQCMESWAYVSSTGATIQVEGCASISELKPYLVSPMIAPTISSTNKSKYCATVETYDPKKTSTTKDNWGYCSCLSNLDMAAVNDLIASYNPLTKESRKMFWDSVKSS